ncbi:MAG: UDP-N-acetylmuramoyl-L-alanine--D-glutamate ligase [Deltaproteobacteria bacterium]|nr:UDP-N-acetylmuramoyl-L-alanine--D-glutamate ligase [Deltaproteobacteria bacterium]
MAQRGASSETIRLTEPVGVAGYGVEGRATVEYLWERGIRDLRVMDRDKAGFDPQDPWNHLPFFFGPDYLNQAKECATVIRSPGIRPDTPGLAEARRAGARVTTATRLFLEAWPGKVAGITGTVGKGTATTLLQLALEAAGIPALAGGNIGQNPLRFLTELSDQSPVPVAVLELSSFQLMDLEGRRPEVAVILRTSSEHLNWHLDQAEYLAAKGRLLGEDPSAQTLIFCQDSPGSRALAQGWRGSALAVSLTGPVKAGVGLWENTPDNLLAHFAEGHSPQPLAALSHLAMPGDFNRENAAAAWLAAMALGADGERALKAIAQFPGLPHRLERAGVVNGAVCYNDSYATRPDAALAAARSFGQPLAMILGGSEKNADFSELMAVLAEHPTLRRAVFMGQTAERMMNELENSARRLGRNPPPMLRAPGLEQAFDLALEALNHQPGVLLFSPACASFDMFPNYKVRGERFRALVQRAELSPRNSPASP